MRDGRLFPSDVRAAGYCAKGMRVWLKARGIAVEEFTRNGLSADQVREMNDEFGNRVLTQYEARRAK